MTPPPARALLAEDEPLLAQALAAELQGLWPGLQWVAQVGDGDSAWQQALALKPDVCFLDIRMPGRTGLDVARDLADDWPDDAPFPLLVFVTAYDQHALEAFEAQAVDYLVKPADRSRLQQCVLRLQQRLRERQANGPLAQTLDQLRALLGVAPGAAAGPAAGPASAPASGPANAPAGRLEVIQAQVGNTVHLVPVDDVLYFEAADKYIRVITAEREHLIRLSLKDLLPQLDPQRFWQVHRGTVVQVRCVASARRDDSGRAYLSLKGRPETLTVSRLYAHLFKGL
jgi:DNA-binding LytR/AlgR family response regulator